MLIPELQEILNVMCPQTLVDKNKLVVQIKKLDEQTQRGMYAIMLSIVADELPFLVEVEMRKQEKKNEINQQVRS